MAKKTINKEKKITLDSSLPQNIEIVGERVVEDKNIYISQQAYKEIHRFTKNKTTNESGGMLIGNIVNEFGKTNIVIQGFIEAKYTEATPTTLTFTHETWDYVHSELGRKYSNGQIVGWIHTHPDFGIFLSEYDKFIQSNFFKEDYQVAYVVDPIQKIEGFYFWINGNIEKCKGFYVFDKTGEKIDISEEKENKSAALSAEKKTSKPLLLYGACGALVIIAVVLGIISMNLFNRMSILESQQENLVDSANSSISYLQQEVNSLQSQVESLQEQVEILQPDETETEVESENSAGVEEQQEIGVEDSGTQESENNNSEINESETVNE